MKERKSLTRLKLMMMSSIDKALRLKEVRLRHIHLPSKFLKS